MYSLAWLVLVGVIGAVLGGWLGHLVARVRSKSAERIQELEAQLESARGEISGYRREVFDQFAATARKFRSFDESYNELHRQLAESASLLCGEAAGPLLDAPAAQAALPTEKPGAEKPAAEESAPEQPTAGQPEEAPAQTNQDVPILVSEVTDAADPSAANSVPTDKTDAEEPVTRDANVAATPEADEATRQRSGSTESEAAQGERPEQDEASEPPRRAGDAG